MVWGFLGFLGWGSLYKDQRITLGKKLCIKFKEVPQKLLKHKNKLSVKSIMLSSLLILFFVFMCSLKFAPKDYLTN